MREAKEHFSIHILAYCLMPNHFHMVVWPVQAKELSRWMQWVMTSQVRRYHHFYGTNGHVWQGRFKSFIVQRDDHLFTLMRYVEGNPVRSGLVDSAKDWRWSSNGETAGRRAQDITNRPPLELPKDWVGHVDAPLPSGELERLRLSVNRQCPYGSPLWQSQLCWRLGLESTIRPKGRPKRRIGPETLPVPFSLER